MKDAPAPRPNKRPRLGPSPAEAEAATKTAKGSKSSKDKAKKGKVAAKATGLQYQFQIMESMGVPREEIKKFADPYFWLKYYPPICIVSLSILPVLRSMVSYMKTEHARTHRKTTSSSARG